MTARTLARLTLGACAVAVAVTPPGASWAMAIVATAVILAAAVELGDPGDPTLSPLAGALDQLKETER